MAFIRKFNTGGPTEEPKKVLTRLNVGDYDAEELSKALTLSLLTEADKYSGSNRLAFLNYGSRLIQAVQDGKVKVNTDGSISIDGNYGLNNTFDDKAIQAKKDNGDVGRGASAYLGEYQRSHGIFTTSGTKNFRENNHLIGLVGRWLMDTLGDAKPIAEKPAEEAPKYTFDTAFVDTHLKGVATNKAEWLKNNADVDKRLTGIINALKGADKTKWGLTDELLNPLIAALEEAKNTKDYKTASTLANKLGFSIANYLPKTSGNTGVKPKTYELQLDDLVKAWESTKATELYPEWGAYSEDTKQGLRNKYRLSLIKADKEKALELENENRVQLFINSNQALEEFDYGDLTSNIANQILLNSEDFNTPSSEIMLILHPTRETVRPDSIDATTVALLINLYTSRDQLFNLNYYIPIDKGDYTGWIAVPGSLDDNGLLLVFNGNKAKRINITALKEGLPDLYDLVLNSKKTKIHKLGGNILFLAEGNALLAADYMSKRVSANTEVRKQLEAKLKQEVELQKAAQPNSKYGKGTEFSNIDNWDTLDYVAAGSAALDLLSLLSSAFGSEAGGSALSAGLGLASTAADAYVDYSRALNASEYLDATTNLGKGLFFDAVSLLPWGKLANAGETLAKVAKYAPYIGTAAAATMAPALYDAFMTSLNKVLDGNWDNLTTDDARILMGSLGNIASINTARKANKMADSALVTGMNVTSDKGTKVNIPNKVLEEMQNAPDYAKANEIFKKYQTEQLLVTTPVNLPKETLFAGSKLNPLTWRDRKETGKAAIAGSKHIELPETYLSHGLFGTREASNKGFATWLINHDEWHPVDATGRWIADKTGPLGRAVVTGVSNATSAGRHAIGRYTYKELGLDPKKQYTVEEFNKAVKAYEHKLGLLDAVGRGNASRQGDPLQESINARNKAMQDEVEALNEQRAKATEESIAADKRKLKEEKAKAKQFKKASELEDAHNNQVKERSLHIAAIRKEKAALALEAERIANVQKRELKTKEIKEAVKKVFDKLNGKATNIKTLTTDLILRFNERLEEYQTAKRRERNLRDVAEQERRDAYNTPAAIAARQAAAAQQTAIRNSLARQFFGGVDYASLAEPLQIKGLEVPSLFKKPSNATPKKEVPTKKLSSTKKVGHPPVKSPKNKTMNGNINPKGANGMKFAQAVINNTLNKLQLEDLETLWLKAGGRMIPKAATGWKVIRLLEDGTTTEVVLDTKPTNEEAVEVYVPDYITAKDGIYNMNGHTLGSDNKYVVSDGYSWQINGEDFGNSREAALRFGIPELKLSLIKKPRWDENFTISGTYSNKSKSTDFNPGSNAIYNKTDKGAIARGLEDGTGTEANNLAVSNFNALNDLFKRMLKGEQITDPNKRAALLKWFKELDIANFLQANGKNHLYFNFKATDNITDESYTWDNLRLNAAKIALGERHDAYLYDEEGNIKKDAQGNLIKGNSNATGPNHESIQLLQRESQVRNYLLNGDGFTLIEGELNEDLYDPIAKGETSYNEGIDYTNNFYKLKTKTLKDADGNDVVYTIDPADGKYKNNGKEYVEPEVRMTPARSTHPGLEIDPKFQWANVSEALRTAFLNRENVKAAYKAFDWTPGLKEQLHRIELLEGNYQALREAQEGRSRLASNASKTFTSDAALQLAGNLTATDLGNLLQFNAAKEDALKFYDSRHKVVDLANQDLVYNTQVGDYNRGVWAQYGKEKAGILANLGIENAKNWSNYWAGIDKLLFDNADRQHLLAIQNIQTLAGNANLKAYLLYLKDNDINKYYTSILDNAINANQQIASTMRPFTYPSINIKKDGVTKKKGFYETIGSLFVKKGGRLTPTHQFILQGSKDFNKRKLEEAREFHKNMRKKK